MKGCVGRIPKECIHHEHPNLWQKTVEKYPQTEYIFQNYTV